MVIITMENGDVIKLELDHDAAPLTCENFERLVGMHFYDGLTFHRVIPGFMIQGGDPQGIGIGGPGYSIRGEFTANGFDGNDIAHTTGVLSMARAQHPDSAGSQFFIMVDDAPHLDGQYAAFGRITENTEAAIAISRVRRDMRDKPLEPQVIDTIRVETFGEDYGEPEKLNER